MADTIVVKWAGVNKFGFGEVKVDDGSKWGKSYQTGSKDAPPCKAGDTVECTLGTNDKGYGTIKNIKVSTSVKAQDVAVKTTSKSGGSEFRTPDQIMRTSALELAIENRDSVAEIIDIINDAITFLEFIKNGDESVLLAQLTTSDPLIDEDVPF